MIVIKNKGLHDRPVAKTKCRSSCLHQGFASPLRALDPGCELRRSKSTGDGQRDASGGGFELGIFLRLLQKFHSIQPTPNAGGPKKVSPEDKYNGPTITGDEFDNLYSGVKEILSDIGVNAGQFRRKKFATILKNNSNPVVQLEKIANIVKKIKHSNPSGKQKRLNFINAHLKYLKIREQQVK